MSGGGTPGPIPNPAVKPASADGSMGVSLCESRPLPTYPPVFSIFLAISPGSIVHLLAGVLKSRQGQARSEIRLLSTWPTNHLSLRTPNLHRSPKFD